MMGTMAMIPIVSSVQSVNCVAISLLMDGILPKWLLTTHKQKRFSAPGSAVGVSAADAVRTGV
jgi:hypothetical protein